MTESKNCNTAELLKIYKKIKPEIVKRLQDFKNIWKKDSDNSIFSELMFCIFTPQSSAVSCSKVQKFLTDSKLYLTGSKEDILKLEIMNYVRFKNNKTKYLLEARNFFTKNNNIEIKSYLNKFKTVKEKRENLVKDIKGFGYKEGSHFLRNIGFGEDIAVLDRHILRNMLKCSLIKEIPKTISKNKYYMLEDIMRNFAENELNMSVSHLDILWWYKETGKIFK